jgi:DNA-binding transcriptional ArsR family regulator
MGRKNKGRVGWTEADPPSPRLASQADLMTLSSGTTRSVFIEAMRASPPSRSSHPPPAEGVDWRLKNALKAVDRSTPNVATCVNQCPGLLYYSPSSGPMPVNEGRHCRSRKAAPVTPSSDTKTNRKRAKDVQKKAPAKRRQPTAEARERATGLIDPDIVVVTKDPLRVQIVSLATQRPIAPSDFARDVGIPLNVASYHFRVLRKHGFLEIVEEVKVRGSTKHLHVATKRAFLSDADWGALEESLRPGVAGQALQDFNVRVAQAMETGAFYARKDVRLYWITIDFDEISWPEFVKLMVWTCQEVDVLNDDTVKRRANGESHESFPATFAIAGFPSPTTSQLKTAERENESAGERARRKP